MTQIALFHSVLGVRPGVLDARDRLTAAGHNVTVIDHYDGRVFDTYDDGFAYLKEIGGPEVLTQRTLEAVAGLPDGLATVGFSNGAAAAALVATQRSVSRVVLISGPIPMEMLGTHVWPATTPIQAHAVDEDPFDDRETLESFAADLRSAGAQLEMLWYHGKGHLFTDPSLPAEYDAEATELLWERALRFLR
ncbi:MAG: dienelactone hydrolase family protein [Candidatus Nanopelagicales bacterium]